MTGHPTALTQVLALFTPIHHDGYKFVVPAALASVLLFLLWTPLGLIAAMVTAALAFFFRDPARITPVREGLIVAPADGIVLSAGLSVPPSELGLGATALPSLSIFLSLLDVHVVRVPYPGRVTHAEGVPGEFRHAGSIEARTANERYAMKIEGGGGRNFGLVMIAGAVARRIVPSLRTGDSVETGERAGLIRFGSRVDLYLPAEEVLVVAEGQRVIAGETVVADLAGARAAPSFKRR